MREKGAKAPTIYNTAQDRSFITFKKWIIIKLKVCEQKYTNVAHSLHRKKKKKRMVNILDNDCYLKYKEMILFSVVCKYINLIMH